MRIVRTTRLVSWVVLFVATSVPMSVAQARDWVLVWADEFDDARVDETVWRFDLGPSNDNIQYYTDRSENAQVADGVLRLIARKESYNGYPYTAALVKTRHAQYWRYGRVEARIQLPATRGLVPAFWMLPEDSRYGWWPASGEIDIMEHPTHETGMIYGTVHTQAYNLFGGAGPRGSRIHITDAESAFHVYAIEWSDERIDFFVDSRRYYTFPRTQGGFDVWPFDQPFYIIMNVAVGGGWVGDPPVDADFPATMAVDYVRVFQDVNDIGIVGPDYLTYQSRGSSYRLPRIENTTYVWSVPEDAEIVAGQDTHQIQVDWSLFGGTIRADIERGGEWITKERPVRVSANDLRNPGFETGVKYWHKAIGYPAVADCRLDAEDVHQGARSLVVDVRQTGVHPWDIQLSQRDLHTEAGRVYEAGFWAKADGGLGTLNAAVIDAHTYALYQGEHFALNDQWTPYTFRFSAPTPADVLFNIDMGAVAGVYHLDDLYLSAWDRVELNPVVNGDFSQGRQGWQLITLGGAAATGSVENEQYRVSISRGGQNTWDVHLGQGGLLVERGTTYTVTFAAYSSVPRTLVAIVGKNAAPWTVYCGYQNIAVGTAQKTYTFSFKMNDPTDPQARLGFDLGTVTGDIVFDNVSLSPARTGRR